MLADELKKGTTPMLILSLLEAEQRHGYELSKLLEHKTHGVVRVHAASLYPLLYRLERQRLIEGRWVEKPGNADRRFYD
jgi:DNA-binding PadR family transcriptional regulator